MAKSKTAKTPVKYVYGHMFEDGCMNYYRTFRGATRDEVIQKALDFSNRDGDDEADYILIIGDMVKIGFVASHNTVVIDNPVDDVLELELED